MITLTTDKRMLGYESLHSYPDIFHFMTTRRGGCSEGAYNSFNCSHYCGDNPERVKRNRVRLTEAFPLPDARLIIPVQTHGTQILRIDETFSRLSAEAQEAALSGVDALITTLPGYCISVSTADCVPILLYDPAHRAVAAVHAGWRGTVARLLSSVLAHMNEVLGTRGEDVVAGIGPSISAEAFEVGEEVYEEFRTKGFNMPRISAWNAETQKFHINLWEANRLQLLEFGVPPGQIEVAGICTYQNSDEFFSARKLGLHSGRMLSGIMLLP